MVSLPGCAQRTLFQLSASQLRLSRGLRLGSQHARIATPLVHQSHGKSTQATQPLLFTPGPLTTSAAVKQHMAYDMGSRDADFLNIVKNIRQQLLQIAGVSQESGYECVIVQGAGSMALESMLGSAVPRDGKLLICSNGSYGERQEKICSRTGVAYVAARHAWNKPVSVADVEKAVEAARAEGITHVSLVHHETTAGVLNDVAGIGEMLKLKCPQLKLIVDSISSFGAYPTPVDAWGAHYIAGSANKCIEGVPGFSFVLARRDSMLEVEGCARSLVLDLQDQWQFMEKSGQFRFTPPVQSILGFKQALDEWTQEGGLAGRAARYQENYSKLAGGMESLGFNFHVADSAARGHIITTFEVPQGLSASWDFTTFYDKLKDRGFVIYPASLPPSQQGLAPAFRVGNIGQLFPAHVEAFIGQVRAVLQEMGFSVPLK